MLMKFLVLDHEKTLTENVHTLIEATNKIKMKLIDLDICVFLCSINWLQSQMKHYA
jgi:hypothetical protein